MLQLSKHRTAWSAYLQFVGTSKPNDKNLMEFITAAGLQANYSKTNVINANFRGTCKISIRFSDEFKKALKKKKKVYSYYGLKSLADAKAKLYDKCFEFIDIYLTGQPYFEKRRRS
jgi:hypothetical protein